MIGITSIRPGLKLEFENDLYIVTYSQHVNPGNKRAFVRAKIKNMKTGQALEKTFRDGDPIKKPDFDDKEMQYLYKDNTGYHFMDNATYEQTFLTEEQMGGNKKFLQENANVKLLYHKGEVIDIQLPITVVMEVTHTEPGLKGDTASGASKPATIETGAVLNVPLFINVGDKLKIDTRTGEYMERAK